MATLELKDEQIKKDFPEIWEFLEDDDVTDLDYNCGNVWQSTVKRIPQLMNSSLTDLDMERFSVMAGKSVNCNFNPVEHTVIADTETLRITCLHKSQSRSGISVNIRKFAPGLQRTREELLAEEYFTEEIMNMVDNCNAAGRNLFMCGLPGYGKTEALKVWASNIPKYEKMVTIQDVGEINYPIINPGSCCSELKVIDGNYKECQETMLRMNAQHVLYGESRGRDAVYLLECMSNGIHFLTSIHDRDAISLPDRVLNMLNDRRDAERIVNQLYSDIGTSVFVKRQADAHGNIRRYIDQVAFYYRKNGENNIALAVEKGKLYKERIPEFLMKEIEDSVGCGLFEKQKKEA